MRKRKVYRGRLSFLLFLKQPQTRWYSPPGVLTAQNSSSCPHPALLCPSVPGNPLPLGCGTALCRIPSSSLPGGALTRPAATSH